MSSTANLVLAAVGGFALGLIYFAALWITLRRLAVSRHPAVLSLGSLLVRVVLALAGFYLIGAGDWRRFLLALGGFIAARLFLVRRWGQRRLARLPARGGTAP
ncbi:MAG: hypothetical protein GTN69_08595 [Armatimonadetes bacterium]|nr:hypothetical protein [Gemmatimonadales bacterium]NIO75922.1 hypothetical protein [Armatimonadota bacterium]